MGSNTRVVNMPLDVARKWKKNPTLTQLVRNLEKLGSMLSRLNGASCVNAWTTSSVFQKFLVEFWILKSFETNSVKVDTECHEVEARLVHVLPCCKLGSGKEPRT